MQLPIHQIDAFADGPFTGNPAAVCPLHAWLGEATMQAIAMENNLSETAFLVGGGGRYDLRWFTPTTEIDLCGHATLASAHVVFQHLEPQADVVVFSTRSGDLTVTRDGELLAMDFPAIRGHGTEVPGGLEAALGASVEYALSAGRDLLVRVPDAATVLGLAPDMKYLAGPGMGHSCLIVTAPGERGGAADFVSRFFAPGEGIAEDPVTGSAHCVLVPYWAERLGKSAFTARQLSKRGGTLHCELAGERVKLKGRARPYLLGTITI